MLVKNLIFHDGGEVQMYFNHVVERMTVEKMDNNKKLFFVADWEMFCPAYL